jgi:hypothetical protein
VPNDTDNRDDPQVNQHEVLVAGSSDPYHTKTTAQLDMEARLAAEEGEQPAGLEGKSYAVEDQDVSNYVGVSPEYRTYADERHAPFRAEEGAEAVFEERALAAYEAGTAPVNPGDEPAVQPENHDPEGAAMVEGDDAAERRDAAKAAGEERDEATKGEDVGTRAVSADTQEKGGTSKRPARD